MADEARGAFDLDRLQQLVELMEKHDLREVKLKRGEETWILRRGAQELVPAAAAPGAAPPPPAVAPSASRGSGAEEAAPADDGLVDVKSPMVGTFYRSPSPDDPPFVNEGDRVSHDTVVCLVEAMKFFNQIKAEVAGTIVKILASDGDPVEYGQALFKVKPE